ncbi:MAG: cofactor-independent phosphoglycerate mutase [Methanosarcinaceae archaeon]|nr:cofactor-independent phosphoglycerate mutase [Methanosarcinaceae archaeon]MDF1534684.1 cofactor-independent phosphoglycerate mutase [Methanosarcinaceae archaeon]
MKYAVLIGDGMADIPMDEFGGKTVLQKANTPNMDYITKNGRAGLAITVPDGMPPGSDIANMSILGYDPKKYYSGRAPLEAASMGISLNNGDVAFRCNLITVKDDIITDYSAGHITSKEAKTLIEAVNSELNTEKIRFYPGISYRHLMVASDDVGIDAECTPPHDVIGEAKENYLPTGKDSELLCELTEASRTILEDHPVNSERVKNGKNPANYIWLWGQGYAPSFTKFEQLYGMTGSIISAVDLLKGIGIYAGLDVIEVPGATGYLDTNYSGKAEYALESLKDHDFVFVHVEAPDEAGHMGDVNAKITAIEDFDKLVVGRILEYALESDEDITILVLPDHPTPISIKTHTSNPVPFAVYSTAGIGPDPDGAAKFDEDSAKKGSFGTVYAADLVQMLIDLN